MTLNTLPFQTTFTCKLYRLGK